MQKFITVCFKLIIMLLLCLYLGNVEIHTDPLHLMITNSGGFVSGILLGTLLWLDSVLNYQRGQRAAYKEMLKHFNKMENGKNIRSSTPKS